MDKEKFLESGLLEQYVLGLTNAEESAMVERYADAFPEVQHEIAHLRDGLEAYVKDQSTMPPKGLKEQILNKIDELEQENVMAPRRSSTRMYLAVGVVLLSTILASLYFYLQYNHQKQAYDRLQNEFQVYQEKCEQTQQALAANNEIFEFLNHRATHPVYLKGTNLDPEAALVVYWNPEAQNALLSVLNLPPPPPEKQYQIWGDVNGKMENMGVFEQDNPNLQQVEFIERPASFNITLEPKGGSEHPNTDLLYAKGDV